MTAVAKPALPKVDLGSPAAAAAALRTFWRLAEAWELSAAEQATLLGVGRTTLYQWKQGKVGSLDRHQLERLSYLFGIYAACRSSFRSRAAPTNGCASRTRRRCSAAGRRSSACSVARSPISMSCGTTSTRSAGARLDRSRPHPGRPLHVASVVRLIPSRYPTVALYDAIADPADLEVVFAIEALTNARIRDELGDLQLVAPEERVSGAGSTPVMAAFTHLNPDGSRFSMAATASTTRRRASRRRSPRSAITAPRSSRAPTSRRSTSTCA
jgi:hypothetical protein